MGASVRRTYASTSLFLPPSFGRGKDSPERIMARFLFPFFPSGETAKRLFLFLPFNKSALRKGPPDILCHATACNTKGRKSRILSEQIGKVLNFPFPTTNGKKVGNDATG